MDLNMPVMGGLDALKLHRFATGGRDLPPFVALTADATEETRRKCAEAGMDACLTKPVDVAHLLDLVDRLTRSRPDAGAGRMAPSAEVVPYPRWEDGTPVLDRAYLDRLRQLDPEDDFLVAIIEDFIADAEHLIDELAVAAAAGDAGTFRDRAHALSQQCRAHRRQRPLRAVPGLAWHELDRARQRWRGACRPARVGVRAPADRAARRACRVAAQWQGGAQTAALSLAAPSAEPRARARRRSCAAASRSIRRRSVSLRPSAVSTQMWTTSISSS